MPFLAIDPGTCKTGWVLVGDDMRLLDFESDTPNLDLAERLLDRCSPTEAAIEMIASYGMRVGSEVFETCLVIGALVKGFRKAGIPVYKAYRKQVVTTLCRSPRAKDADVAQYVKDFYVGKFGGGGGSVPAKGIKSAPGPLYGLTEHCWQALGIAVAAHEDRELLLQFPDL